MRFKNRFLLVHVRSESSQKASFADHEVYTEHHRQIQFLSECLAYASIYGTLQVMRAIRDSISMLHGDYGSGCIQSSFQGSITLTNGSYDSSPAS